MAGKKNDEPLETGAVPGEVPPDLAARAQAEVDAARSAPKVEIIGNVNDPPKRKRGRPPGSTNKPKVAAPGQAPNPAPQEDEENEPCTPADMAEIMDLFSMWCVMSNVPPVEDDVRDEWAKKAAKVANKWGGSIPLQAEISLAIATGMIMYPRVSQMLDPEHQAKVAADKALAEEKAHNERVRKEAPKMVNT